MDLTWSAFTLREGEFIADLPGLKVSSVGVTMCDYTSTTAVLPIPTAPDDWERALLPMASMLVLMADGEPQWGGIVLSPARPAGEQVTVSLVTFERLMAWRYVADRTFAGVSQTEIVASLAATLTEDTPLVIEAEPSQVVRDRTYADSDDMTLLDALTNLAGVESGPEWTVTWRTDGARVWPVLRVADRLGVEAPGVAVEIPGAGLSATLSTQTGPDMIANHVTATSTLDDGTRVTSGAVTTPDPERPRLEFRWSPGSKISAPTLADHARGRLSWMQGGAESLSISMIATDLLLDGWDVGDSIDFDITTPALTRAGTARVLGWSATLDEPVTVTLILAGEGD